MEREWRKKGVIQVRQDKGTKKKKERIEQLNEEKKADARKQTKGNEQVKVNGKMKIWNEQNDDRGGSCDGNEELKLE